MITTENITKSFGSLKVLKGIDLHIDRGEVVSIVGPSGAGKTTLLQIIGTLDRPDQGSVCVDGVDTTTLSRRALADFRNRHLGFVFQFHQLLPEFTALENIMIPAYIAKTSKKEAKARALELLKFMNLSDRASHKPAQLSGGEKQRVAVARALINNPAVILADEPSGSLDSKNKAELHQLFFDLRNQYGQTFVIVTHDEQLAQITDRTIHLRDGLIVDNASAPFLAGVHGSAASQDEGPISPDKDPVSAISPNEGSASPTGSPSPAAEGTASVASPTESTSPATEGTASVASPTESTSPATEDSVSPASTSSISPSDSPTL